MPGIPEWGCPVLFCSAKRVLTRGGVNFYKERSVIVLQKGYKRFCVNSVKLFMYE